MMNDAADDTQREMLTLLSARVRDTALGDAPAVDGGTDLPDIGPDADLFEALWMMAHHRVHRLRVRDGERTLGVLSQDALIGLLSNHSHVVALAIAEARSEADLAAAARRIDALLALLHDGGLRVERVARLVGSLNRRLFARLWSLVAPPELVANSCLIVMGSEGRGEQIEKTDQDNALVLRDGFDFPTLAAVTQRFAAGLAALGWPPCPGDIMLTNPRWCAPVARLRETIRDWVHGDDPEGPLQLAIFFDAAAVAGDGALLDELRAHLDRVVGASDAFVARFGAAADQFDAPTRWWARLTGQRDELPLDLKKLGTFPIVHGVRALCLAHGVRATGTAERIALLQQRGELDATLALDLTEALHYLMGLKLRHQLRQRAAGQPPGNLVRPCQLSTLERDQFKGALEIVGRFRALLRQRLRLDAL